jgi:phosphatidylserine/phosphatidylglycerophosphate/cardiolipin synthase-like enzyme
MRILPLLLMAGALIVAMAAPRPFLRQQEPVLAPVRIAFGPTPGFDAIDPDLIGRAEKTIDMAAYVLSHQRVIEALSAAASRGVQIRIYFDPEQFRRVGGNNESLQALTHQPNIRAKLKADSDDMMHLKAYAVDGRWLRTGSTNFSWSGETRQDNDILVIDSADAAQEFTRQFDRLWARRGNRDAGQ